MNIFEIKHKRFLLTGGYGYLASELITGLNRQGAEIIFVGRAKEKCDKLLESLEGCQYLLGDIRNQDFLDSLIFDINNSQKPLHGIVHAAYAGNWGHYNGATIADFSDSYQLNVTSPFYLTRGLLPKLAHAPLASVVFMASMYGHVSPDPRNYESSSDFSPPQYASSKAAMLQISRYFTCHCEYKNVRFNTLSPGAFPNVDVKDESFVSRLEKRIPIGRIGKPHELVGPVTFLLSDASSYMTGADLKIDGGWTAW